MASKRYVWVVDEQRVRKHEIVREGPKAYLIRAAHVGRRDGYRQYNVQVKKSHMSARWIGPVFTSEQAAYEYLSTELAESIKAHEAAADREVKLLEDVGAKMMKKGWI